MDIKQLIRENQEEILSYITELLANKTKKHSPSIKLKFIALGKQYTSDKSIDRKSTRLNSSHITSSYAVFCLNKKPHTDTNKINKETIPNRSYNHTKIKQ